jgi:hypothetical protein
MEETELFNPPAPSPAEVTRGRKSRAQVPLNQLCVLDIRSRFQNFNKFQDSLIAEVGLKNRQNWSSSPNVTKCVTALDYPKLLLARAGGVGVRKQAFFSGLYFTLLNGIQKFQFCTIYIYKHCKKLKNKVNVSFVPWKNLYIYHRRYIIAVNSVRYAFRRRLDRILVLSIHVCRKQKSKT